MRVLAKRSRRGETGRAESPLGRLRRQLSRRESQGTLSRLRKEEKFLQNQDCKRRERCYNRNRKVDRRIRFAWPCAIAEWGEKPREWVTVMHARHAKSDTPELDLCSCRHRELIGRSRPHGWWLCGRFCLKLRLIPLKRTTGNAAHTERFPDSAAGGSPLAAHCQKRISPPATGTAGGPIFCIKSRGCLKMQIARE